MSSRPAQEVFFEDFEGDPCLLCGRPAEDLAERPWKLVDGSEGIDHACDSCLAALEVAHGLMDNEVKDENEIITTIALAADAGGGGEVRRKPPSQRDKDHSIFQSCGGRKGGGLLRATARQRAHPV
jgi:hypothetical protein